MFKRKDIFVGGFKIIHPDDVAYAIIEQIKHPVNHKITGVWY
ncbi:hypothetical protein [Tunicatimonas pelagia]|nr:hypothetical protein [Tunicatimonas pelagia]WKN44939.1 hypothetical protein P0M28_08180 [Tunicatimonas pelagia]